jgi:hypothetical protein
VSSLLSQEIAGKYGVHRGGWFLVEARTPYGVCFWRNIRNVWENFSNSFSFEVGDGSHICFWYDVWYGEAALKTIFLDLYLLARHKVAMVLDYLCSFGISFHWNPSFTRAVQVGSWNL